MQLQHGNPKDRILNAAARVVQLVGAGHLTIDAVAKQAGLSKGGMLYHYPNKRSLLGGMVQHVIASTLEHVACYQADHTDEHNMTVRALIFALQQSDETERAMSLAILAAAAEDPGLLDPARVVFADLFRLIKAEGEMGVVLLLAIEGLRFVGMLNLLPLDSEELSTIHQQLRNIAEET